MDFNQSPILRRCIYTLSICPINTMSRYNIIDAHQRISTFHPPDLQPKGHYYYKKKNTKQIFNAKNNIRRTQSGCNEIFFHFQVEGGWNVFSITGGLIKMRSGLSNGITVTFSQRHVSHHLRPNSSSKWKMFSFKVYFYLFKFQQVYFEIHALWIECESAIDLIYCTSSQIDR